MASSLLRTESVTSVGAPPTWARNPHVSSSVALVARGGGGGGGGKGAGTALDAAVAELDAEVAASTRSAVGGGGAAGFTVRTQLMPDGSIAVVKKGEFKMWNGDRFVGETYNDRRAGHGVLYVANGDVYMGDFKNGAFEGFGVMKEASLIVRGVECRGRRYQGEWAGGVRQGKGMQRGSNGDVYEGQFVNDRMAGYGVMRYASGNVYNGCWKDGRWDGDGKLFGADTSSYVGAFRMGQRHGHGMQRYRGGGSYTGGWRFDRRQGVGRRVWASGAEYEGEWEDDHMAGRGMYKSSAGSAYVGSFADDRFHGEGTYVGVDGTRYQGWFHAGGYVKSGKLRTADGSSFTGEYNALLRCGVTVESAVVSDLIPARPDRRGGGAGAGGAAGGGGRPGGRPAGGGSAGGSDDDDDEEDRPRGLMAIFAAEREDMVAKRAARRFKARTTAGHVIAGSAADIAWLARGKEHAAARTAPAADGKRHGRGVQVWANGARYDGEWYQDQMHGRGRYSLPSGSSYDGEWQAGVRHGRGKAVYTNDGSPFTCPLGFRHDGMGVCTYDGGWVDGAMQGYGNYTCADGHSYSGYWRGGKKHGAGVLVLIPPTVSGMGTACVDDAGRRWSATFCAMREYRGQFDDGDRHGDGVAYLVNGDEMAGTFVRNKLEGVVRWHMRALERTAYGVFKAGIRVAWVTGRAKLLLQLKDERPDLLEVMGDAAADVWTPPCRPPLRTPARILRSRLHTLDSAAALRSATAAAAAERALATGTAINRVVANRVSTMTLANMTEIVPFMRSLDFRPRAYVKLPPIPVAVRPPTPEPAPHPFHYKPPAWLDELE